MAIKIYIDTKADSPAVAAVRSELSGTPMNIPDVVRGDNLDYELYWVNRLTGTFDTAAKFEIASLVVGVGQLGGSVLTSSSTWASGTSQGGIAVPVNASFTDGAGTLATGTYYYRVSAVNATGETSASTETSRAVTGPVGINVNWGAVTGATGYRIYGRATGAELFIAEVGAVTTYLDSGAITPAGALPTANTSGTYYAGSIDYGAAAVVTAIGSSAYLDAFFEIKVTLDTTAHTRTYLQMPIKILNKVNT